MSMIGLDIDAPLMEPPPPRKTLEQELVGIIEALLNNNFHADVTVKEAYDMCVERARTFRNEAISQNRSARQMALGALAEEMEAQASTWMLVYCLYCESSPPAGKGGPYLVGGGGTSLYRQRLADAMEGEADLARCARVVEWLEALADDALGRQAGVHFAAGEGLWNETKTAMRARAELMELDPDAPGRTGRPLHASNMNSQEKMLARLWSLMRAGKLKDAQGLCHIVCQPWRSAAHGGGGLYGTLPVGTTAVEYDTNVEVPALQKEELADEVANGSGSLLALWRWASRQAAAAGPPGDTFERAVFGALGGNTAAAMPACTTWEDYAWLFCRSWLESKAMRTLMPDLQAAGDLVMGDAVTAALVRCGVAPTVAQRSVDGALSVVTGCGGAAAAAAAGPFDDARLVQSFGQMFAEHLMVPAAMMNAGTAAVQALRQIQAKLILGDMYDLVCHLYSSLVIDGDGGAVWGAGGDVAGGAIVPVDDSVGGFPPVVAAAFGGVGGGPPAAAANPERRQRTCALAAHLLLVLGGLGQLRLPLDLGAAHMFGQNSADLSHKVLKLYTRLLMAQGQLQLVPPYLCVLPKQLRDELCQELLGVYTKRLLELAESIAPDGSVLVADEAEANQLRTAFMEVDQACCDAVAALGDYFRRCVEVQSKPLDERSSFLVTTISHNELRLQLHTFTATCRGKLEYGPFQRARIARWLAQPHLAAAASKGVAGPDGDVDGSGEMDVDDDAAAAAAGLVMDPGSYCDLLLFANCLCCEFALGDDVTATAGRMLLEQVLPRGLRTAVIAAVQKLRDEAVTDREGPPSYLRDQDLTGGGHERPLDALEEGPDGEAEAEAAEAARWRAEGEAEAARKEQLAARIEDLLIELEEWRVYYDLDSQMLGWTERYDAYGKAVEAVQAVQGSQGRSGVFMAEEEQRRQQQQQEGEATLAELMSDGGALLKGHLDRVLKPNWQKELATSARAFAAASNNRIRISLMLTSPTEWNTTTSTKEHAIDSYQELQGAKLGEFRSEIASGLNRAFVETGLAVAKAAGKASMSVTSDSEGRGRGAVTVDLEVVLDTQLWRDVVELVCSMVLQELPGMPNLMVVSLDTDRSTSLAICRRCCIAQIVKRCAGLRLTLVRLGMDANSEEAGSRLVEILAEPTEASGKSLQESGLLELLSQTKLREVLNHEADTFQCHMRNMQERRRLQNQAE